MDVGCSQWGFAASMMSPQHHKGLKGSAIPQSPKIYPHLNTYYGYNKAPICPSTASQGAKILLIHPIWMWDAVNEGFQPQP